MPSFLRSLSAHASGHFPSHVVPSNDLSRRLWAALLDEQEGHYLSVREAFHGANEELRQSHEKAGRTRFQIGFPVVSYIDFHQKRSH